MYAKPSNPSPIQQSSDFLPKSWSEEGARKEGTRVNSYQIHHPNIEHNIQIPNTPVKGGQAGQRIGSEGEDGVNV